MSALFTGYVKGRAVPRYFRPLTKYTAYFEISQLKSLNYGISSVLNMLELLTGIFILLPGLVHSNK